jgi:hypothetical protein
MLRKIVLAFAVVVSVLGFSSVALAKNTAVMRVIMVKTDHVAEYVQELEKGKEILRRIGSPAQLRVWQTKFAGEDAGTVMVQIEYPSLTAYAADDVRVGANEEYQTWLKGLDKIRKIVSDSLYREL